MREARAFSGGIDAVSVAAGAGIDVSLGDARFVGHDAAETDGRRLESKKAPIASCRAPAGTRPAE